MRRRGDVRLEADQRVVGAPHHSEGRQLVELGVGHAVVDRADGKLRMRLSLQVELFGAEEQRLRRERGALRVAAHQPVALAGVLPKMLERRLQVAVQDNGGVDTEIVENRRRLFKKQRQVVLDACGCHAVAHVFVDAALGRIAFQHFAPTAAETRAGVIVHREFASRQKSHFGHRIEAALRVGIEGADRVDLVVEQVDAKRHERTHGKQVDQSTAYRVFARAHDLSDVRVAGEGELCLELRILQLLFGFEVKGIARQKRRRRQPIQRRGGRHEDDVGLFLADAPQRGQPFADEVLVRRKAVVGQRLPVGKKRATQLGREEGDFVDEALRVVSVSGEDCGGAARGFLACRQLRQHECVGRQRRARQRESLARRKVGEVHESLREMQ